MKKISRRISASVLAAAMLAGSAVPASAYSYLDSGCFGQTTTFSINTWDVAFPYFGYSDNARSSWNYVDTWAHISGVSITDVDSSENIVTAQSYSDTWYGLYTAVIPPFSNFNIKINTGRINAVTAELSSTEISHFYQSVIAHELGHALGLADNPETTLPSIMKGSRDRTTVTRPQPYDIAAVDNYYYTLSNNNSGIGHEEETENGNDVMLYADYQWYDSLEELFDKADMVIQCREIDSSTSITETDKDKTDILPYTVSEVLIEKTFKGDDALNTIKVKQLGGKIKDVDYVSDDTEYLNKDRTYILFLKTYDDSPASLLNPIQGMYYADNDRFVPREKNDINTDDASDLLNDLSESNDPIKKSSVSSDHQVYKSYEEMYDDADLIIKGNVTENNFLYLSISDGDDDKLPYTVSDVEIVNIIKGSYSSKHIDVKQLGGRTGDALKDAGYLKKGEEYILFLKLYENSPASLLNNEQGMVVLQK